jgi:hypothetical protein
MAESRMRVAVFKKGSHYQVRLSDATGRDEKLAIEKLNIGPCTEALERMDDYDDLRNDDFFISKTKEICITCERGRLLLLRSLVDELKLKINAGWDLLPDSDETERSLSRQSAFTEELEHLMEANLPFYRRGVKAFLVGSAIRLCILVVVLLAGRLFYLQRSDHYQVRSLQAIMKTADEPHTAQNFFSFFMNPNYTHRSKLYITTPLYIRGNNVILEGGLYVKIDGIQNLKASLEAHGNNPLTIKVDTRAGEMKITGVLVGEDLIAPKGTLIYQGRIPVSGQPPMRVDALDTNARGAYVRVRDADPEEDATFNWMLGQSISIIATLSSDGDRYLIGQDEFKFAIPKSSVKPEIREILDTAASNRERAIVDMRLSSRAYPMRNRRNPRMQRKDTNIVTEGNMHFVTVQSAVLKNI